MKPEAVDKTNVFTYNKKKKQKKNTIYEYFFRLKLSRSQKKNDETSNAWEKNNNNIFSAYFHIIKHIFQKLYLGLLKVDTESVSHVYPTRDRTSPIFCVWKEDVSLTDDFYFHPFQVLLNVVTNPAHTIVCT